MDPLTQEQFKAALPDRIRRNVNQQLIDNVNKILSDPDMYETYRENLLSYAHVMADGKFKIENYIWAVKYVSYKLMGKTNTDAFTLTFPDKIQDWQQRGVPAKDMASYISAYNKSKLVSLLMEQTIVPTWVLNQDMHQQAINHLAHLMLNARSEKVQQESASKLVDALKPPEVTKVQMDIKHGESDSMKELREATLALAAKQREALQAGAATAKEVAEAPLVIDNETGEAI